MHVHDIRNGGGFAVQRPREGRAPAALPAESPGEQQAPAPVSPMTEQEREFFVDLYPRAEALIRSYALYQRSGVRPATLLGTIIDRRA